MVWYHHCIILQNFPTVWYWYCIECIKAVLLDIDEDPQQCECNLAVLLASISINPKRARNGEHNKLAPRDQTKTNPKHGEQNKYKYTLYECNAVLVFSTSVWSYNCSRQSGRTTSLEKNSLARPILPVSKKRKC